MANYLLKIERPYLKDIEEDPDELPYYELRWKNEEISFESSDDGDAESWVETYLQDNSVNHKGKDYYPKPISLSRIIKKW
jgi:hypothetical protein